MAESLGLLTIVLEAPEDRQLAEMLVPKLRSRLSGLSRKEQGKQLANQALGILRSFASAFKLSVGDVEFGVRPEIGIADSGDLEADLPEVFLSVAGAAKVAGSPIAIFIDEVQYLSTKDLSALITSVHKMNQKNLPFLLFGAGLPQLAALAGEAKSYAERLFNYPEVGSLREDDAIDAIRAPLAREGVQIEEDALSMIVEKSKGYPYFLQEWGFHTWEFADSTPITIEDVRRATTTTLLHLDKGLYQVRLDRLTSREKDYMRAMAELGAGPHRSGEIAKALHMDVTNAGPLRNELIKKGMIFSPKHGDTAFTVPMFDEFMIRSMPMPAWGPGEPSKNEPRRSSNRRKRQPEE